MFNELHRMCFRMVSFFRVLLLRWFYLFFCKWLFEAFGGLVGFSLLIYSDLCFAFIIRSYLCTFCLCFIRVPFIEIEFILFIVHLDVSIEVLSLFVLHP